MIVKQYAALSEISPARLATLVNEHIALGWQPYGSLCVGAAMDGSDLEYIQAMVIHASLKEQMLG